MCFEIYHIIIVATTSHATEALKFMIIPVANPCPAKNNYYEYHFCVGVSDLCILIIEISLKLSKIYSNQRK